MIAHRDGTYRCYTTTNGIRRHYSGCSHETPREAIRHTANHPYISPLRVEGMSTPVTARDSSPLGSHGAVLIPAARKRTARLTGQAGHRAARS